jgi:protease-4
VLLALLVVVGYLGFRSLFFGGRPTVEKGSWLELSFGQTYPEQTSEALSLSSLLRPEEPSHEDFVRALRRAKVDPRIKGVLLRPDLYPGGWAQAQELRTLLQQLREAGKPVWAYLSLATSRAYFLATAADSIAMAPEGNLLVLGLQAKMTYYKELLSKLGVQADFIAIGAYKSAPETWTRQGPSDPARQQVEVYVDAVYDAWIQALAKARGFSKDHMEDLVDRGHFDARGAVEEGLVDRLVDSVDLRAQLGSGGEDLVTIGALDYLDAAYRSPHRDRRVRLALIYATGDIVPGHARPGSGLMGSDTLIQRLRRAREDDQVKAVVLRVDSPGGSTLASDLIWRELERLRAQKPLVVCMGDLAASGAYYISMSADAIVAEPLTLTGSIGVFVGKADLTDLYQKVGINHEVIARGDNADLFTDLRPFSDEQREEIRAELRRFYERFVDRVAEGRGMSFAQADSIARGRVWSGEDAMKLGLVDGLGGLEEALQTAKNLAGIPPDEKVALVSYRQRPSMMQRMLRGLLWNSAAQMPTVADSLSPLLQSLLLAERSSLAAMDGTPQFRLPWQLRVE